MNKVEITETSSNRYEVTVNETVAGHICVRDVTANWREIRFVSSENFYIDWKPASAGTVRNNNDRKKKLDKFIGMVKTQFEIDEDEWFSS